MSNLHEKSRILELNSPLDEISYYNPEMLIEKSKGIYLWAEGDSEPYVDLLMGYSSTNFGHVNDQIKRIVIDSVSKFDNITSFNSASKIELTKKLIALLPFPSDSLVYYPVGGTKAIDAAIKLARAFTKKKTIISFNGAFHGYSYAGMSVTDKHFVEKKQFAVPISSKFFDFPDTKSATAQEDSKTVLNKIENYLKKEGDKVAAIIFEPIQGAAGFIIPPDKFLEELIILSKKYNVLSICDEIQTGICRTGTFYYINQIKIDPDIVLLSKSLAGGYYPLSAVIAKRQLFMAVDFNKSGFDSTFANNLLAVEIANGVVDYIKKEDIAKKVVMKGKVFLNELKKIERYGFIKDVGGIGMAFSYRIQAPSNSKIDNAKLAKIIRKIAFLDHLIIQTAGIQGNYMKLAPSFFITQDEMKVVFDRFNGVLTKVNDIIKSDNWGNLWTK